MPCIYKITNKKNGKFYIGMTKNLPSRWKRHLQEAKLGRRNSILYSAIRKYGEKSFRVEIIEHCSHSKLPTREVYWIAKLQPPYNMTAGGYGWDSVIASKTYVEPSVRTPSKLWNVVSQHLRDSNILLYSKNLFTHARKDGHENTPTRHWHRSYTVC